MRLQGEAYSKRLREYSDDTILLISKCMSKPREVYQQCRLITSDSELNEEEVVKRLKELFSKNNAQQFTNRAKRVTIIWLKRGRHRREHTA